MVNKFSPSDLASNFKSDIFGHKLQFNTEKKKKLAVKVEQFLCLSRELFISERGYCSLKMATQPFRPLYNDFPLVYLIQLS